MNISYENGDPVTTEAQRRHGDREERRNGYRGPRHQRTGEHRGRARSQRRHQQRVRAWPWAISARVAAPVAHARTIMNSAEIPIIRSAQRARTITLREREGQLEVLAPADMSDADLAPIIERLVKRQARRQ